MRPSFVVAVILSAVLWAIVFASGVASAYIYSDLSDERRLGRLEMLQCMQDQVLDQFGPAVDSAVFADAIHTRCLP